MSVQYDIKYGLPGEVKFCKACVISNQRPSSTPEFKHRLESKKHTITINDDGICDACKQAEIKESIDWESREKELLKLLDQYRKSDGSYDCVVPGSGGKDSAYASHILKYKYGMNPLTVTWPPILYTTYGMENFRNWIEMGGFDNITYKPDGRIQKLLTKLSIENLMHPFQTFIIGQKNIAPKFAINMDIPLIFYGENQAEYGNPIAENTTAMMEKSFYTYSHLDEIYLGGVSIKELMSRYAITLADLRPYLPPLESELKKSTLDFRYLGYYLKWTPQEVYYYAVENTGFKARPFRTQGTYSKYSGIDDKIDDFHFYTTYLKFGIGRATYDACQEIRNKHLTREEGMLLVKKYDGEFPDRYFLEIMEYLDIDPDYFKGELSDKFRSPHLWTKSAGEWKLRHTVTGDGVND
jgi:N-acetyl sugar amidotransferase